MLKNKPKTHIVIFLLLLIPLLAPFYLLGMAYALIHMCIFCGYKNSERYFMEGMGFETQEDMFKRILKEQSTKG